MKIPEQMTVRVVSTDEEDLSGLIVELMVTTGSRNPYYIQFPRTDSSGMATLTRDDFVGQFTDHWESDLMGHSGTPASASSRVQVALYDPSWSLEHRDRAMAWPLLQHERTKWSSREEEYRHSTSSRNLDFLAAPIEVDLEETSDFTLPVQRRGEHQRMDRERRGESHDSGALARWLCAFVADDRQPRP